MKVSPAATSIIFDREMPEDYVQEWTNRVSAERTIAATGTKSVVIFKIAAEWLALPTDVFQEVVDQCVVRTLPHQRSGMLTGLANVRGDLLLCVTLGVLLGLESVEEAQLKHRRSAAGRLLICNRKGDRLAFRADEIFGVERYQPRELREAPSTLAKCAESNYIVGVLPWHERTVGCLDDELIFYALNKGLS